MVWTGVYRVVFATEHSSHSKRACITCKSDRSCLLVAIANQVQDQRQLADQAQTLEYLNSNTNKDQVQINSTKSRRRIKHQTQNSSKMSARNHVNSTNKMKSSPRARSNQLKCTFLIVVSILCCLSLCALQPAGAFLHCFTPNMFKMGGKVGHPSAYPGSSGGASWYPQMNTAYQSYGQNPMSRLFKPKWMGGGGGGLFGPKRWMDWRLNSASMNSYRPNQVAYWPPVPPAAFLGGNTPGFNQFSDNLNSPSYSTSNAQQQFTPINAIPSSSSINSNYGQSQLSSQTANNDGWSYPSVSPYSRPTSNQQTGQLTYGGDSYTVSPNSYQPNKQQLQDPYGTKGVSGGIKTAKNQTNLNIYPQKRVLVADGV